MQDHEQCKLTMGVTVHLADLANTSKQWGCYSEWIKLLFDEFHRQGDLERERGMTLSHPNNDRAKSVPYKAQYGFINMFVLDLFDAYTLFLPALVSFLYSAPRFPPRVNHAPSLFLGTQEPAKEQLHVNLTHLSSESGGTIGERTRSSRRSKRAR